jgi:hypothetical protein
VIAQLMMILLAMVAASLSPVPYQLIFPRRRQHRAASRRLWQICRIWLIPSPIHHVSAALHNCRAAMRPSIVIGSAYVIDTAQALGSGPAGREPGGEPIESSRRAQ